MMKRTGEWQASRRDVTISIRATVHEREMIDRAARMLGKSRSGFIRDVACRGAADVMLDQVYFRLDEAAFDRFNALLDAPPSDALRKLMRTRAPWD